VDSGPYADHPIIARAAFRGAVKAYPKSRIRLRNRVLVMEEHMALVMEEHMAKGAHLAPCGGSRGD
jgi:hypothetical protein